MLADAAQSGGLQASDYTIGGVAVAVIGFAGTVVKIVLGMLETEKKNSIEALGIERARGDRLEISAMQAIPALTTAGIQEQASQDLIKTMGAQMLEMARAHTR